MCVCLLLSISSCEPIASPHLPSHLDSLRRVVVEPWLAWLPVFWPWTRPLVHPSVKLWWWRWWRGAALAWVPVVDVVHVGIVAPAYRTIEVVALLKLLPLLGAEQCPYPVVAIAPAMSVDVAIAVDAVKVGQVKTQDVVALDFGET